MVSFRITMLADFPIALDSAPVYGGPTMSATECRFAESL